MEKLNTKMEKLDAKMEKISANIKNLNANIAKLTENGHISTSFFPIRPSPVERFENWLGPIN